MRARSLQGARGIAGTPPAPTLFAVVGLSGHAPGISKILSSERSCDQFQSVMHQHDCVRLRIIPQTVHSTGPVSARQSARLSVNGISRVAGRSTHLLRCPPIARCMQLLLTRRMDTLFSLPGAKPCKLIRQMRAFKPTASSRPNPRLGLSHVDGGHPTWCLTPDETSHI